MFMYIEYLYVGVVGIVGIVGYSYSVFSQIIHKFKLNALNMRYSPIEELLEGLVSIADCP